MERASASSAPAIAPGASESLVGAELEAPDRLGRYRLIAVLARGGMGDVHLALLSGPADFNKLLVVKELRQHGQDEEAHLAMFLNEARLAARLNHPNVVQTLEIGAEGERRFIAMEYLDGQPLHRLVHRARTRGTPMPIAMHFAIAVDILTALEYAHALCDFDGTPLGIVHRDVSPQNVFVTYDGIVKLIDFGVARATAVSLHTTEMLKGKIRYMSPEQAACRPVDRRSDVFSVGVMLWEGIVGSGPWGGRSDLEILHELAAGRVPRLGAAFPHLDEELVAIVERAMEPEPEGRFATALELRRDLERYVDDHGLTLGRELSAFITGLFAEDRRKLREVIEARIRQLGGPMEPLSLSGLRPTLSMPTPFGREHQSPVPGPVAASVGTRARAKPHPFDLRPIGPWIGPAGAALAAVVVAAVVARVTATNAGSRAAPATAPPYAAWAAHPSPPQASSGGNDAPSPSRAFDEPTSSGAPRTVHVVLRATPAWARLYVDDRPVSNPFEIHGPPDPAPHRVRAVAPGYVPRTFPFDVSADADLPIALERTPAPASRPQRSAPGAQPSTAAVRAAQAAPAAAADPAGRDGLSAPEASGAVDLPAPRPKREVDQENPYAP